MKRTSSRVPPDMTGSEAEDLDLPRETPAKKPARRNRALHPECFVRVSHHMIDRVDVHAIRLEKELGIRVSRSYAVRRLLEQALDALKGR